MNRSLESPEEQEARIDVMLQTMVVEAGLHAYENGEPPPLHQNTIGDFGLLKDHIRRIEEETRT